MHNNVRRIVFCVRVLFSTKNTSPLPMMVLNITTWFHSIPLMRIPRKSYSPRCGIPWQLAFMGGCVNALYMETDSNSWLAVSCIPHCIDSISRTCIAFSPRPTEVSTRSWWEFALHIKCVMQCSNIEHFPSTMKAAAACLHTQRAFGLSVAYRRCTK